MNYYEEIGECSGIFLCLSRLINVKDFCCCVYQPGDPFFNKNMLMFFSRRRRSEKNFPEVQQELQDQQIDYMMYMPDSNKNTQQTDHVWVQEFRQKPICL